MRVTRVDYGENEKDSQIYVQLDIVEDEARRVRTDSIASIEGKGLLGDKMLVISVGSSSKPPLNPGSRIQSKEADDLGQMMQSSAPSRTRSRR